MKEIKQSKEHKAPYIQLVRMDESNKVFFAASGKPGSPSLGSCSLESIEKTTGVW